MGSSDICHCQTQNVIQVTMGSISEHLLFHNFTMFFFWDDSVAFWPLGSSEIQCRSQRNSKAEDMKTPSFPGFLVIFYGGKIVGPKKTRLEEFWEELMCEWSCCMKVSERRYLQNTDSDLLAFMNQKRSETQELSSSSSCFCLHFMPMLYPVMAVIW